VHAPFYLFLMLRLFLVTKFGLPRQKLLVAVMLLFQKFGCDAASEPSSDSALNIEGSFCSLFVPHGGREVLAGVDDLVGASVDV